MKFATDKERDCSQCSAAKEHVGTCSDCERGNKPADRKAEQNRNAKKAQPKPD
jgi:hypothetical protein